MISINCKPVTQQRPNGLQNVEGFTFPPGEFRPLFSAWPKQDVVVGWGQTSYIASRESRVGPGLSIGMSHPDMGKSKLQEDIGTCVCVVHGGLEMGGGVLSDRTGAIPLAPGATSISNTRRIWLPNSSTILPEWQLESGPSSSDNSESVRSSPGNSESVPPPSGNSEILKSCVGVKGDSLPAGEKLGAGQCLVSKSRNAVLIMQLDGNLVLYKVSNSEVLWASSILSGDRVENQLDGNLVVYKGSSATWASNTAGQSQGKLVLQDDYNLVLYAGSMVAWATGTNR